VIQWVHRSTRGWSYGSTITDPRTGQILKGHVSLGSQRVRQDYLIAEALLSPYEAGQPVPGDMQEMALARLRQLSAHEVGHTLGFQHNYIASADGLSSVMDYPHPMVTLKDDSLSLEDAYDTGIGEWDKVFVAYGYQDFPGTVEEEDSLKAILEKARTEGLRFLSDRDARGEGSAHPHTHLWDNSPDAVAELERVITIRHHLLKRFSEKNIREGIPYSELEKVLVPAYMFHRYQLEAAAKTLGGMHYNYALRGEELKLEMVSPADQLACLDAVLKTIEADFLAIPEEILEIIPPKPLGYRRDREHFKSRTGVTFDPLAATESAAGQTLTLLFNAQRATRIVENHARAAEQPGLQDVLGRIIDASWHI
ncbi:MAG: zinc-dependent metalloprotease, partial [Bacteroidales bacterium]|nr:zinc-dependent metalloprotease [Bacteroidales bacterium]